MHLLVPARQLTPWSSLWHGKPRKGLRGAGEEGGGGPEGGVGEGAEGGVEGGEGVLGTAAWGAAVSEGGVEEVTCSEGGVGGGEGVLGTAAWGAAVSEGLGGSVRGWGAVVSS